jgi:hypothetical protein
MAKDEHIVRYTAEEMSKLASRSDWERASRMTDEEIEAAIASDPDERDMVVDWSRAQAWVPPQSFQTKEQRRRALLRKAVAYPLLLLPALLNVFRASGKR